MQTYPGTPNRDIAVVARSYGAKLGSELLVSLGGAHHAGVVALGAFAEAPAQLLGTLFGKAGATLGALGSLIGATFGAPAARAAFPAGMTLPCLAGVKTTGFDQFPTYERARNSMREAGLSSVQFFGRGDDLVPADAAIRANLALGVGERGLEIEMESDRKHRSVPNAREWRAFFEQIGWATQPQSSET